MNRYGDVVTDEMAQANSKVAGLVLNGRCAGHIGSSLAGPKVAAIFSVVESCRRLQVPVRDYFSTILPGFADLRSGAFQTLLPLCGLPGVHRLKRPGY